jgi:hypothetical protein
LIFVSAAEAAKEIAAQSTAAEAARKNELEHPRMIGSPPRQKTYVN